MKAKKRSAARPDGDGVGIYISPVMFIMAVYFVAVGMAFEYVCSLSAVMLHECAHARVAKKLGYELNVIKLMPYGAALCGEANMPCRHEIAVAIAGPLFNFALVLLFVALWWLLPSSYVFTDVFTMCNLYIGAFNILPVYPLDGGRVVFAALSSKTGRKRAYKIMRIISAVTGLIAIALFIATAFYSLNICLLSIGLFMTVSSFIPDKTAKYGGIFTGERRSKIKRPTEVKRIAVRADENSGALISALDPDKYNEFIVLDDNLKEAGELTETEFIEGIKTCGYSATVKELLSTKK